MTEFTAAFKREILLMRYIHKLSCGGKEEVTMLISNIDMQ